MRIRRVTPFHADHYLFVEIETDGGLVGLGESSCWGNQPAVAAAVETFAAYLVGRDPGPIEHHWSAMQQYGHFRGAALCAAISAIDIALWDLKGQALGVPIHVLLGGPTRERVRLYGHVRAPDAAGMAAACLALQRQGFTAVGHLNAFLDDDPHAPWFRPWAARLTDALALLQGVRDAVGWELDLCLEAHRRLTPPEAIAFGAELGPLRPLFYEDPIPPESPDAMALVAARLTVPVATGERLVSPWEFQTLLARGGVQYLRPSIGLCGGLTGARRIAALAEAHGLAVVPHSPMSPVSLFAALQLAAAVPNLAILEFPCEATDAGWHLPGQEFGDRLPAVRQGFAEIPTEPGLGIRLRHDAVAAAPGRIRDIRMRPHRDGFVVNH